MRNALVLLAIVAAAAGCASAGDPSMAGYAGPGFDAWHCGQGSTWFPGR